MRSMQHFTYKYWSTTQTKRGGNFDLKEETTQKQNPKSISSPSRRRASPPPPFGFLSSPHSSFPTDRSSPPQHCLFSFPLSRSPLIFPHFSDLPSPGHRPTTATNQLPLPQILPLSCSLCSLHLLNLPPSPSRVRLSLSRPIDQLSFALTGH